MVDRSRHCFLSIRNYNATDIAGVVRPSTLGSTRQDLGPAGVSFGKMGKTFEQQRCETIALYNANKMINNNYKYNHVNANIGEGHGKQQ
jgi:hypothetical protein